MPYSKKRIFVVEGDKDTTALVKVFLESQGYQITLIPADAEEIIDLIFVDDIALYVINEKLPDRHSIELCRRIRATDFVTPILICSSSDDESYIEDVIRAGADDYISTPQDWIKLIDKIRFLTDYYLRDGQNAMAEIGA